MKNKRIILYSISLALSVIGLCFNFFVRKTNRRDEPFAVITKFILECVTLCVSLVTLKIHRDELESR